MRKVPNSNEQVTPESVRQELRDLATRMELLRRRTTHLEGTLRTLKNEMYKPPYVRKHVPLSNILTGSEEFLGFDISILDLSPRTIACLTENKIKTIGDLLARTENDLLMFQNVGRTTINEIKGRLAVGGFTLENYQTSAQRKVA